MVRQYALAWGHYMLAREVREAADPAAPSDTMSVCRVVLAGDGRPETTPLLAAACEGLRMAGCHVLELGAGTAPLTVALAAQRAAAGAIFVGNPPGLPHTAGLCLLGPGGIPADHAALSTAVVHAPMAMRHRGGRWQAVPGAQAYLARFKGFYHGLRPLKFVVHSTCCPLLQWIGELTRHTGCTALCNQPQLACSSMEAAARKTVQRGTRPQTRQGGSAAMCLELADARPPALQERTRLQDAHPPQELHASIALATLPNAPLLAPDAGALAAMRRHVLESGAHFGMWCDGDGRRCYVLDERGHLVPPERLLQVLAGLLVAWSAGSPPAVVLEQTCDIQTIQQLASLGLRVHQAAVGQHSVWQAMLEHGAALGGGPSGCLWLALPASANGAMAAPREGRAAPHALTDTSPRPPAVAASGPQLDALAVLTLWLHILSRQNLPASGVLEQPLRALVAPRVGSSSCAK